MRSVIARFGRAVGSGASHVARRLRPGAATRSPAERGVLDDIAMRRPWNLRVKAARRRARFGFRRTRPGVTVVVVNWNTSEVTADVITAVQHFSPPGTSILLIDNGSTDASRERFARWPGIDAVFLRSNAGHGVALDLGMCWARTSIAVALDSDAIPLRDDWLDAAVEPIRRGDAVLTGLRSRRGFVHPVYLAIDTKAFVTHRWSFQVHRDSPLQAEDIWGDNAWDTGEVLTGEVAPELVRFVEPTPNRAAGLPGMTVGDVVYHHGGVSRDSRSAVSSEAFERWRAACRSNGVDLFERDGKETV